MVPQKLEHATSVTIVSCGKLAIALLCQLLLKLFSYLVFVSRCAFFGYVGRVTTEAVFYRNDFQSLEKKSNNKALPGTNKMEENRNLRSITHRFI